VIAGLLILAAGISLDNRRIPPGSFVVPQPASLADMKRSDSFLVERSPAVAHAASAVLTEDGKISAIWFSGQREAGPDVRLMTSIYDGAAWSKPVIVTDGPLTGKDVGRYTSTVGNSVVFRHPDGDYWLIYVSVGVGGWSLSSLNLKRSQDGVHWGPAQRIVTGPFLNISTLVKGPALIRSDGLVALPAYHEFISTFPEMIFLNAEGAVVGKVRMAEGGSCAIQPAAVALGGGRAVALLRDMGCWPRRLLRTATDDGGLTWTALQRTDVENPNSPAAVMRLNDGRLLALANDSERSASVLDLLLSSDEGQSWTKGPALFDGRAENANYRYPLLLQDLRGRLHVLVTETVAWREKAIRHAVIGTGDIGMEAHVDVR
jgi:predicted neuraminidase